MVNSVTVEENEQVVQYALNKRPNVRLVETGLTFGKEGFTKIMGKKFHPSLKLTRRYYPHSYNVDGFFVAKFKKIGPTPPNAVGANGVSNGTGSVSVDKEAQEEYVDKAPIVEEDADDDSDFGGWDEEEDQKYMERLSKSQLRRKGRNPKADLGKARQGQTGARKEAEQKKANESEDGASVAKKANRSNQPAKVNGVGGKVGEAESKPSKKNGKRKI